MAMQRQPTTIEAALYPEEYIIEKDLSEMGDTNPHNKLIAYIEGILKQRFRVQGYLVIRNVNIYHKKVFNSLQYVVPDNALIEVALPQAQEDFLTSWDAEQQPPSLVFEVASEGTWPHDIQSGPNDKPVIYGRIGVKEYFSYDPNVPQVWTKRPSGLLSRLRGWRYNALGQPVEIKPDARKRLWSEVLQCFLSENQMYIRFTDDSNKTLLTDSETNVAVEEQARKHEEEKRKQTEQQLQQEIVARQEVEQQLEKERQARLELERRLAEFLKQQEKDQ